MTTNVVKLDVEQASTKITYEDAAAQYEVTSVLDTKEYLIKVPVAKVGSWKHPLWGEVKFSSEDLDVILTNFKNNELGFEPPIYFGHSTDDGKPAQGFLKKIEREGDLLFGYWAVHKETYRLVEDGVYRYSSAELFLDYPSKKTGKKIGKVIYGMALTNIPYVPNLPKIQTLDHANIDSNVILLSFVNNNSTNIDSKKEEEEQDMEQETKVALELALKEQVAQYTSQIQKYEEQVAQKHSLVEETSQKLSQAVEENKALQLKLEEYEQSIRAKDVEFKLARLNNLTLPNDFKQTYSNLIKENKLGCDEVESVILSSLESLNEVYSKSITDQVGQTEDTANLNNVEFEDPFKDEIEHCKELIKKRDS